MHCVSSIKPRPRTNPWGFYSKKYSFSYVEFKSYPICCLPNIKIRNNSFSLFVLGSLMMSCDYESVKVKILKVRKHFFKSFANLFHMFDLKGLHCAHRFLRKK